MCIGMLATEELRFKKCAVKTAGCAERCMLSPLVLENQGALRYVSYTWVPYYSPYGIKIRTSWVVRFVTDVSVRVT